MIDAGAGKPRVVPFAQDTVMNYLDGCISNARYERETAWLNKDLVRWVTWRANMDTFQSVRLALFGESLPEGGN